MNKRKSRTAASGGNRFVLTPIAAAVVAAMAPATAALAQDAAALDEITVTAQKRTQNLQDVPISVQVLGNEQLENLNIQGFEEFIHFIPTVSIYHDRPGISQVYMRGISSGGDGNHSASMPSVGVYLDEQPITTINHVLDMHLYDVARIESLSGPQGTFFGSSSQSGTLRIITNKPQIGEFEAGIDASVNQVNKGGTGYSFEGFANIPVSDKAAIRLVGWHKETAGFIDNIAGTIDFPGPEGHFSDNAAYVEEDFNTVTVSGMRAMLKVDLNENWTVTPGIIYQQQESNGVWQHDPEDLGDLNIQRHSPDTYDDDWYQSSLTLDGNIGDLNLVYAGTYLDRDAERNEDYIGYAQYLHNYYYDYYQNNSTGCYHHSTNSSYTTYECTNPAQNISRDEFFKRSSHELRLQSSSDGQFRWTAGLFYQRQEHDFDLRWNVPGMDPLGSDIWPIRPPSLVPGELVVWQTDQNRVDRDSAFFGEVEYDITDSLTVVAGYRRFDFENSLVGYNGHASRGCLVDGELLAPCSINAPNIDDVSKGSGNTYKFSVNYSLDDNKMVYFTYSEGYRAGGVNRARAAGSFLDKYNPDFVDNYEFGWKTSFLDGRMRFNGAVYSMDWDDFQLSYNDYNVSILTIIQNVGNAETTGVEFDLAFAATDDLTFTFAGSYNDAILKEAFWTDLEDKDDGAPPTAAAGGQLPYVPELKMSATGRWNMNYGSLPGHIQAAVSFTDDSWTELNDADRQVQNAYTILNLSTGVQGESWSLDLFIDNATDERAEITRNHGNYYDPLDVLFYDTNLTVNRPRSIGLRYGRRF